MDVLHATATAMLSWGWDVILDECYCSLNRRLRWDTASRLHGDIELIAVVFPERDMKDHIDDKIEKGLRGKTVEYWKRVFCEMKKEYEMFLPTVEYFSNVMFIGEDKP
jgi:hypothetical protein